VKKILIAIDGPAGSGKSTTARLVAKRLGYTYVDTGAMYRAVTLKVLTSKISPSDESRVVELAEQSRLDLLSDHTDLRVILDGNDVTDQIRSEDVTKNVSLVSSYPGIRKLMVDRQREIGARKGCVVDGRDIGTVVFPDAELKFFMTADIMERARRRQLELSSKGTELPIVQVVHELKTRDMKDSTRETSPLRKADDAVEIDTTNMTIDEQVGKILGYVNEELMTQEEMDRK